MSAAANSPTLASAVGALCMIIGITCAMYLMALAVGLGRCSDCERLCEPWNATCWRHRL